MRKSNDVIEADVSLSPLDASNVRAMEFSKLGKSFLGPRMLLAKGSHVLTETCSGISRLAAFHANENCAKTPIDRQTLSSI